MFLFAGETTRRNRCIGQSRQYGDAEQVVPGGVRRNGRVTERGVDRSQQTARVPEDASRSEY